MVATEYNSPQPIIDNLHSAVIVIGENLQIVCMNPSAEMLFHISNNRAVRKNIRELVINEHEFLIVSNARWSLATPTPFTMTSFVFTIIKPSMSIILFHPFNTSLKENFYYLNLYAWKQGKNFHMKKVFSASMKPVKVYCAAWHMK